MPNPLHSNSYKKVTIKLKEARLEAGLTQIEVAKKLGKPQSFVSKIESAERRLDITELNSLAKIYKKEIKFFIG